MNTLIEALNAWANPALRFAWPMLWQSSLLIALLFALELLLKRKVRSAVRYALWLVVLVKLLLPPSLAFPTSAGWWLRPAIAPPTTLRPTSITVTYGAPERPQLPTTVMPVFVEPPPPCLSSAAWLLVAMIAVSLALLTWMTARWCQVARRARRAVAAPVPLAACRNTHVFEMRTLLLLGNSHALLARAHYFNRLLAPRSISTPTPTARRN